MKNFLSMLAVLLCATLAVNAQVTEITQNITTSTTWKNDKIYLLKGFIYVKNGATLTIEPGTLIKGNKNAAAPAALIVTRGCRLVAEGTPNNPIVLTSDQPKGERSTGDWGGVILLGKAKTNHPGGVGAVEGCVDNADNDGKFGGDNDDDDSGSLKYVRIEYAGIACAPDNELNGLTFGAVGRGTKIDYVQVSFGGDDSFEWFGGSVNCKHLIAYKGYDDDFDTDNGFSGKVQYALGYRDSTLADKSGSNGFESDNNATGTYANPFTKAIFSNATIIGPLETLKSIGNKNFQRGAHIRRNSGLSVQNSVIMGYPKGMFIQSKGTIDKANADTLQFRSNIIAGMKTMYEFEATNSPWTFEQNDAWFKKPAYQNRIFTTNAEVKMTDAYNYNRPNLVPQAGSPALSGATFTGNTADAFFDKTDYVGAFGTTDWTKLWANYRPDTLAYNAPKVVTTAANDLLLEVKDLSIYPNPAQEMATIRFFSLKNEPLIVSIFSITGQIMTRIQQPTHEGTNQITIPTNELQNGLYLLQLASYNGHTTVAKLSVSR
jgi:Secretion system C-terminal sorting domain